MTKENPEYEVFMPSKELARIIYDNITKPTREEFKMLESMFKLSGDKWPTDGEMALSMIKVLEKEVYGSLTSFAKHCLYCSLLVEGSASVSEDGKFVAWIFLDLIERLCMNVEGDLSPAFDRLYSELAEFYSIPKQYVWGRVSAENGELKVFVNDDAFKLPDFDKPDSKRRHVAK